ncbi:tyrosine-type recombinase/integrase [Companilactobacillus sp. FL22-1]|uniref:tyrosine-type recombinase/integrase n=1 Tax=Companilactobacillus sp. FL22-1 TaxID=3373892 RepID=UPI0037550372
MASKRAIKGINISLNKRQNKKSWYVSYYFKDEFGNTMKKARTKTFGKNTNTTTIDDAFIKAYDWIIKTQESIDKGKSLNGNMTLNDYITNYWEKSRVDTATYIRYSRQLRKKEFNELKKMRISAINLNILRKFFDSLASKKLKNGEYPSESMLDNYKKPLSNVLNSAVEDQIISENTCRSIKTYKFIKDPKKSRKNSMRKPFSKKDLQIILESAEEKDIQQFNFIKIMASTGLRTGEMGALDIKSSFDLDNNKLIVDKVITESREKSAVIRPYTKTGVNRVVCINDETKKTIENQIKLKMEELSNLMSEDEIKDADNLLLFSSHYQYPNRPLQVKKLGEKFTKLIKDLDVHQYSLYSLRHSYATLHLDAGGSADAIAQQMGHNMMTFYQYYVGDLESSKREVGNTNILDF